MSDDAAPFFIQPHRFDEPAHDERSHPRLDRRRHVVLDPGERALWRGRAELAGHLLGPLPGNGAMHWSLSRPADVMITDRRLAFVSEDWVLEEVGAADTVHTARRLRRRSAPAILGGRVVTGQIRWQWPSRLHLLPAVAAVGTRPARPAQVLLVCDSLRTIRQPGLALRGGDLGQRGAARELVHRIRRAIAEFRLANPGTVELSPPERDALAVRAGAGLFIDELADQQRGIHLPGSLVVEFVHRDDYYRRAAGSSPSSLGPEPQAGDAGLWQSGQPGSAS